MSMSDDVHVERKASSCPVKGPVCRSLSLNEIMIHRRSSLKATHSALVRDYEQNKQRKQKSISFSNLYGYEEAEVQEPPLKKRRFQRRNSKTPAMLMAMNAALDLDFLKKDRIESRKREQCFEDAEDDWDGGLEIAEELVKELQQRRRSGV